MRAYWICLLLWAHRRCVNWWNGDPRSRGIEALCVMFIWITVHDLRAAVEVIKSCMTRHWGSGFFLFWIFFRSPSSGNIKGKRCWGGFTLCFSHCLSYRPGVTEEASWKTSNKEVVRAEGFTLSFIINNYRVIEKSLCTWRLQSPHNWWFEDGHRKIHSECGPCYTEHGLREHSSACQ